MPGNSMRCTDAAEVFLLLKSSDFVAHDLSHCYATCEDRDRTRPDQFVLVLRRWYDLDVSMEFRCFVAHRQLIGTLR